MTLNKKIKNLVIVDYDCGNLHSIKNAFDSIGIKSTVTSEKDFIAKASHIVLPGVGAFDKAIQTLKKLKLIETIRDASKNKKPILGICLGMQLLFDKSVENKPSKGLGLIDGQIIKIKSEGSNKVPVVGWNKVKFPENKIDILRNVKNYSYFYFIHSYKAKIKNKKNLIGSYFQTKQEIPAIISNNKNILGCQFHPEKSGKNGIQILKNFLAS